MLAKRMNNCVRLLTAAAFMLVAFSATSQPANPLAKFGGNWTGNGLIYLSNGTKERIRCRGGFTLSDILNISSLKMDLLCAGDSYNFELSSDLRHNSGVVSGTWTEKRRGFNGEIMGTINGDHINVVAASQTFNATLEIINMGDKQQVRVTSPGGEITDVLIGLNRSGSRPAPPVQPTQ
jgi:hypothetical protein